MEDTKKKEINEKKENKGNKENNTQEIFRDYHFDLGQLLKWVEDKNIQNLGIQLPEGLKLQSNRLVKLIENELNINVVLLADPCFGACDIPYNRIDKIKVDGLVQFGHSIIPNCLNKKDIAIQMEFVELHSKINPAELLAKKSNITKLSKYVEGAKRIGILTTIQYISYLEPIKNVLESIGLEPIIRRSGQRIKYGGQVLGCNFSSATSIQEQVDTFLFIGDGKFHPIGVSLSTKKPVIIFDPVNNEFSTTEDVKSKLLKQRGGAIARAKECREFGILISTKPGQCRIDLALKIQSKLKENNRSGTLIVFDFISPENVDYLPFDAYINTACPRLTVDDYLRYKKPIITPIELEIVLNNLAWDEYTMDQID
jgi:2-(3-amino-3-carboxypropyl)histidine synthase